MSPLLSVGLGLLAASCFGASNYLSAPSSKRLGVLKAAFYAQAAAFVLMLPVFALQGSLSATARALDVAFLQGIAFSLAWLCLFRAIRFGPIGLVTPIAATSSAVTVLIAVLWLGESVTTTQVVAILIVVVGLALASLRLSGLSLVVEHQKAVVYAVMSAIFTGVSVILFNQIVDRAGIVNGLMVGGFFITVTLGLAMLWKRRQVARSDLAGNKVPWLMGGLQLLGAYFLSLGLTQGQVSLVAPASASSPLFASLLAHAFLGERLPLVRRLGGLLAICGLMLLAVA